MVAAKLNKQDQGRSPHEVSTPLVMSPRTATTAQEAEDPLVELEGAVGLLDSGLLSVREYELLKQHILTDLMTLSWGGLQLHRTKAGVEVGLSKTPALLRTGKGVALRRRSGQVECGRSGARHLHQCCIQSRRPWSQRLRWSRRSTAPRLLGVQGVRQPSMQSLWSPFRASPPPSARQWLCNHTYRCKHGRPW
jgi:hypothetical protein